MSLKIFFYSKNKEILKDYNNLKIFNRQKRISQKLSRLKMMMTKLSNFLIIN